MRRSDPAWHRESRSPLGIGLALVLAIAACQPAPVTPTASVPPRAQSAAPATSQVATTRPTASPDAPFGLFGPIPTGGLSPTTAAALDAVIRDMVAQGAPDAIAAVITPNGAWSGAAGVGGPDGRSATARDEFYLASLSQMFVASVILKLAEDGKIDLDAPLARYLDGIEVNTNGATVRQALGMRSGLADYGRDATAAIQADGRRTWTAEEILGFFPAPAEPAGTRYRYAGPNYVLLGLAAQRAAGTSLAAALRTRVLDPVGATRVLQQDPSNPTPKPWALPTPGHFGPFKGTDFGSDGVISCRSSVSFSFGSGSMAGDAPSVASWVWHLFAGDVVSEASVRLMVPTITSRDGFGLHVLSDLGKWHGVGHTGQKTAYGSIVAVLPAERTVVVLFVNNDNFIVEPFVVRLIAASQAG